MLRQLKILCKEKHKRVFSGDLYFTETWRRLFFYLSCMTATTEIIMLKLSEMLSTRTCIIKTRKLELESVYIGL